MVHCRVLTTIAVHAVDIKVQDTAGHGPVYEQIRSQIAAMIESGELAKGVEVALLAFHLSLQIAHRFNGGVDPIKN